MEADPAVMSARRVREGANDDYSRATWRERLTSNAGRLVPPCLVVEDPEREGRGLGDMNFATDALEDRLKVVNKTHSRVRLKALTQLSRNSDARGEAREEGLLIMRFSPDLLCQTVNILRQHQLERESNGECVAYLASMMFHSWVHCITAQQMVECVPRCECLGQILTLRPSLVRTRRCWCWIDRGGGRGGVEQESVDKVGTYTLDSMTRCIFPLSVLCAL